MSAAPNPGTEAARLRRLLALLAPYDPRRPAIEASAAAAQRAHAVLSVTEYRACRRRAKFPGGKRAFELVPKSK